MSRIIPLLLIAAITLASHSATAAEVTFNKHIAPLVWQQCANCHRPGQVAPFSLLSYRDVQKRAEQIREITAEGLMPPWSPAPGHVAFANGRRLSRSEERV